MDEVLKRDQNHVTVIGGITDDSNQYVRMVRVDPVTNRVLVSATGLPGGGTVTSVSVVPANGFAGTVANPTSMPAITLTTSVTGILQGNGTAISAITIGSGLSFVSGTLSSTGLTPTSGQYKTFVTVGNANADYLVGNYIDVGDAVNAAFAALSSTGGTIFILAGSYNFTTPMVFNVTNKYPLLLMQPGGATILNWTATSGTAITFNVGASAVGSGTPNAGWGIDGMRLVGPGGVNTAIGIFLGGTKGAQNANIKNSTIRDFNLGTETGANCWCVVFDNCYWVRNTQHWLCDPASNSGENMRIVNSTFADALTIAGSVTLGSSSCASISFDNVSFDDVQLVVSAGNEAVTINGGHFENPAGGAAYDFIIIGNDSANFTNVTVTGTNFYMDATTGTPAQFISNGGNLNMYGVTATRNSGATTASNFVKNVSTFGSSTIQGFRSVNTAANAIMNGVFPAPSTSGGFDFISSKINSFPFGFNQTSSNVAQFWNGGNVVGSVNQNSKWNFGDNGNGTGFVTIAAGTTTVAPLVLKTGTLNTTTQTGAVEFDSSHLYFSPVAAGARYRLDQQAGYAPIDRYSASGNLLSTQSTLEVDATSGGATITLPTAASAYDATSKLGRVYTVKKIDSSTNTVTLQGNGAETIDGSNTQSLANKQYAFIQVTSNGTSWDVVGGAANYKITSTGEITSGSASSVSSWSNAQAIFTKSATGDTSSNAIGVVGEAVASGAGVSGRGVFGSGKTNGADSASGVMGNALVTASADTGLASGVRGTSLQVHSGGDNYGVIGIATNSGTTNYGMLGNGTTNGTAPGYGLSAVGLVGASGDTGDSVGGVYTATVAHSGGRNIGVLSSASNGATNYAFYASSGWNFFADRVLQSASTVASGTNITLTTGNTFDITGTTAISTIQATGWTNGSSVILRFSTSITVNHNTAGTGAVILLAGAVNFSATANDSLTLSYNGTSWQETARAVI